MNDPEEVIDTLKKVYKEVRQAKKAGKRSAVEEDAELQIDVCVECTDILFLTQNVNEVIDKMADQSESAALKFEAGNLEAVRRYVEVVDSMTGEKRCFNRSNELLNPDFRNFDETALKLELDAPLYQHFHSIQLRGIDGTKTVWLRGRNKDQLKFIKVTTAPGEVPHISVYSLPKEAYDDKLITHLPKKEVVSQVAAQPKEEESDKEIIEYQYEYSAGDEADNLSLAIGPELRHEDYIPKELKILEVKGRAELEEGIIGKMRVEINDRKQEGIFNLVDENERELASLRVEADGKAKMTLPSPYNTDREYFVAELDSQGSVNVDMGHELRMSSSYVLKNVYRLDNSGNASIVSEHRYGDNLSLSAEMNRMSGGSEKVNATGKWKVDSQSSVILKLIDIDSPNEQVWLSYERRI